MLGDMAAGHLLVAPQGAERPDATAKGANLKAPARMQLLYEYAFAGRHAAWFCRGAVKIKTTPLTY
jgi:hypothetical protein